MWSVWGGQSRVISGGLDHNLLPVVIQKVRVAGFGEREILQYIQRHMQSAPQQSTFQSLQLSHCHSSRPFHTRIRQ